MQFFECSFINDQNHIMVFRKPCKCQDFKLKHIRCLLELESKPNASNKSKKEKKI